MTTIDRITKVLNLADRLKLATVRIEEMKGICITFEDKNGDLQALTANLDDTDPFYLWHNKPYEELIKALKNHTR